MNSTKRKVSSAEFFARHPVFSLEEANRELAPPGGRAGTLERLRYHIETGRLKLVARGLYAVVPPGTSREVLRLDPYLVAVAVRPDAVFSHHSALELLGAAHSVWRECTLYTGRRRRQLVLEDATVRFFQPPAAMDTDSGRPFGTRRVERRGRLLVTTGPERTLVEGLRRPRLAGGLEELVVSASGFPTLDLEVLEEVLLRYGTANLWAATGWFLERFQRDFHVPEKTLERWTRHVPAAPQYVERGRHGGTLVRRWNLIVPVEIERVGSPDER